MSENDNLKRKIRVCFLESESTASYPVDEVIDLVRELDNRLIIEWFHGYAGDIIINNNEYQIILPKLESLLKNIGN